MAAASLDKRRRVLVHLATVAAEMRRTRCSVTSMLCSTRRPLAIWCAPTRASGRSGRVTSTSTSGYPPTSQFDGQNERHRHLVDLAIEAEQVAVAVALPEGVGFQQARKIIRAELDRSGTTEAINVEVAGLLGERTR